MDDGTVQSNSRTFTNTSGGQIPVNYRNCVAGIICSGCQWMCFFLSPQGMSVMKDLFLKGFKWPQWIYHHLPTLRVQLVQVFFNLWVHIYSSKQLPLASIILALMWLRIFDWRSPCLKETVEHHFWHYHTVKNVKKLSVGSILQTR